MFVVQIKFGSYGWLDKDSFKSLDAAREFLANLTGYNSRICERNKVGGYFVDELVK